MISLVLADAIRLKINNLLDEYNVNVWYVCKYSGIPCSTLTTFLNGKTKLLKLDTLLHICEVFNITLNEFFEDSIFYDVEAE